MGRGGRSAVYAEASRFLRRLQEYFPVHCLAKENDRINPFQGVDVRAVSPSTMMVSVCREPPEKAARFLTLF